MAVVIFLTFSIVIQKLIIIDNIIYIYNNIYILLLVNSSTI